MGYLIFAWNCGARQPVWRKGGRSEESHGLEEPSVVSHADGDLWVARSEPLAKGV